MKLRTHPPDTPVPIYLAAVGPAGWDSAIRVADGVATFYSDKIAETRQQFMTERIIPVAVLIPFSLSRTDFFESRVTSIDGLRQRVAILEETGFDEVIIAYGDIKDLEASAQVLEASV